MHFFTQTSPDGPGAPAAADFPFPPYEKIAERLSDWLGDDEAAFRAAKRVEWVVTEKIHGANFCLVKDGQLIRCAKRKAWLAEGEDFFGHQAIRARLEAPLLRLFQLVRAQDPQIAIVFLYGELFGGGYPHPEVATIEGLLPVQTGCWYSPNIEFSAFDLGYVCANDAGRAYADQDTLMNLCEAAGVPFAKPLFRGSYEDAFAYPLGFETTIPAQLGLPSLGASNQAEGVVLKPQTGIVVPRRAGVLRPIIKQKIAAFAEEERYHGAEKWAAPRADSTTAWLEQEVSALVTDNRLYAAISKVGRLERGDGAQAAEVLALLREDIDMELGSRHPVSIAALSAAERASLERFIQAELRALIDLYLEASSQ
jgi:Rnl2 family RNA ligase